MTTKPESLSFKKLTRNIGAVASDFKLNGELDEATQETLMSALLEHQVLFFRDNPLNPDEQANIARQFGTLHIHPVFPHAPGTPEIVVLDNWQTDLRDNAIWHTDVTFSEEPPLGCLLAAKKVPAFGGDTCWSSSHAAWRDLSEPMQNMLEGLTATHNIVLSFPRERFGNTPETLTKWQQMQLDNPPVVHPVVRTHPKTGKKMIFVNEGFTTRINELSESESRAVLDFLFKHIAKPEYTVRWHWQTNDLAIWDNRATQHYATNDYDVNEHRIMHRATINGDRPY